MYTCFYLQWLLTFPLYVFTIFNQGSLKLFSVFSLSYTMVWLFWNSCKFTYSCKKTTGSLRNVNSKLLNKICANQIQPDIQRIMYHNQLISSTRMLWQTRLNNAIYCIYRMKDKIQNPPNRFRKKVFGKNQTLFYVKNNLNKTLNRRKLSQANKRNL